MKLPLSLRFAGRELRAGTRGFRIFLACLALGVAAIAAASSTAEAFRRGLAAEARTILGGDVAVSVERRFTQAERAAFEARGRVSYAMATRAMAESPAGLRRHNSLRARPRPLACNCTRPRGSSSFRVRLTRALSVLESWASCESDNWPSWAMKASMRHSATLTQKGSA